MLKLIILLSVVCAACALDRNTDLQNASGAELLGEAHDKLSGIELLEILTGDLPPLQSDHESSSVKDLGEVEDLLDLESAETSSQTAPKFLRLCPDDNECSFFGAIFDKPEDSAKSKAKNVKAKGEQGSSFFTFQVKSNTVDEKKKINQYEMMMQLFMFGDTERTQELSSRMEQWDTEHIDEESLKALLLKHAGELTDQEEKMHEQMTKHPIYFRTDQNGKMLQLCCHNDETKSICEFKRMIITQALEEVHPAVHKATEDIEFRTTDDSHHFDSGTTQTQHKVKIFDKATNAKRIHMTRQGSRHITMDTLWEVPPSDDILDTTTEVQSLPGAKRARNFGKKGLKILTGKIDAYKKKIENIKDDIDPTKLQKEGEHTTSKLEAEPSKETKTKPSTFTNPHMKANAKVITEAHTEGDLELKKMTGSQLIDVDVRDPNSDPNSKTPKEQKFPQDSPQKNLGAIGTQSVGNLFSIKRLKKVALQTKLSANKNLNKNANQYQCQNGYQLLQVLSRSGHGDVDKTTPSSFDMDKFKAKVLRSGKGHVKSENLLSWEYGALHRNLAHIHDLDAKFRGWLKDGSISPEAGRKWLALLGGTDHDLAEEALVAYVNDTRLPDVLSESALFNLMTPRKRMNSTIKKVCQLATQEHVHRDQSHMICGALLQRYAPLEGSRFLPEAIQQHYNQLHQKVKAATSPQELAVAIGALGNTRFKAAIAPLLAHSKHAEPRVRSSARAALGSMKQVHPAAVMEALIDVQSTAAPKYSKNTVGGHEIKTGNPNEDAVEGDDCGNIGLDGALFCLSDRKVLSESDHHLLSGNGALGLGLKAQKEENDEGEEEQTDEAISKGSFGVYGTVNFAASLFGGDDTKLLAYEPGLEYNGEKGEIQEACTLHFFGKEMECPTPEQSGSTSVTAQLDNTAAVQVANLQASQQARDREGGDDHLEKYDWDGLVLMRTLQEGTFYQSVWPFVFYGIPLTFSATLSGSTWVKGGMKAKPWVKDKQKFTVSAGAEVGAAVLLTLELNVETGLARFGVIGEVNLFEGAIPMVGTYQPSNKKNTWAINLGARMKMAASTISAYVELGLQGQDPLRRDEFEIMEFPSLLEIEFDILTVPAKRSGLSSGLEWKRSDGTEKPKGGTEFKNAKLAAKLLNGQTEFTQNDLDTFGVKGLRMDHFVTAASGKYFEPLKCESLFQQGTDIWDSPFGAVGPWGLGPSFVAQADNGRLGDCQIMIKKSAKDKLTAVCKNKIGDKVGKWFDDWKYGGPAKKIDLSECGDRRKKWHDSCAKKEECKDTSNWINSKKDGHGCAKYASMGWCKDGAVPDEYLWTIGKKYNNPEQNCCVCGKPIIEVEHKLKEPEKGICMIKISKCADDDKCMNLHLAELRRVTAKNLKIELTDKCADNKDQCGGGFSDILRECCPQTCGDCSAGATAGTGRTCKFSQGDGKGSSEKKLIKKDSEEECAKYVATAEPNANGATFSPSTKMCYAEFEMTGKKANTNGKDYRTCQFSAFPDTHCGKPFNEFFKDDDTLMKLSDCEKRREYWNKECGGITNFKLAEQGKTCSAVGLTPVSKDACKTGCTAMGSGDKYSVDSWDHDAGCHKVMKNGIFVGSYKGNCHWNEATPADFYSSNQQVCQTTGEFKLHYRSFELTTNECGNGLRKVDTEAECKTACESRGSKFEPGSYPQSPGCTYVAAGSYAGNCHWNTNKDAKNMGPNNRQICMPKEDKDILSCEDDDECIKKENEKWYYKLPSNLCELNEEKCTTTDRTYSDALMKCCKQTCGMCWAEELEG